MVFVSWTTLRRKDRATRLRFGILGPTVDELAAVGMAAPVDLYLPSIFIFLALCIPNWITRSCVSTMHRIHCLPYPNI